jgi:xylan 1,4-beta-xylosidase
MRKPAAGEGGSAGMPLSDGFSRNRFGVQWSFFDPVPNETDRVGYEPGGLSIAGQGSAPADSAPLACTVGDRAYEAEVSLDLDGGAEGGLLLFYSHKAFVGIGFDGRQVKTFAQSEEQPWMRGPYPANKVRAKVTNDANVVTFHYSKDGGRTWTLHGLRMEVSGYNHNTFGGFLALKIGIYSADKGRVRLSDFQYRALGSA